jgi:predicted flap endonuclease-1-like 5' DNA nuclease
MRSDYALYAVAVILFILTGVVAVYAATQQLWIVTTAVVGFVFIGLGYWQRPQQETTLQTTTQKPTPIMTTPINVLTPPPPPPTPKAAEVMQETTIKPEVPPVIEIRPPSVGLLDVKGIKEKRAQQLKAIGINTVEDLAKASPQDLATKLKIAPYFTGQWIENAKKIATKS